MTRPHDAPEWLWYGEVEGEPVVTFGRCPKHGAQHRYKYAELQPTDHDQPLKPWAWCGWHPDHGLNLSTIADTQQHAVARLMRTGIAGANHGWSVVPLGPIEPPDA